MLIILHLGALDVKRVERMLIHELFLNDIIALGFFFDGVIRFVAYGEHARFGQRQWRAFYFFYGFENVISNASARVFDLPFGAKEQALLAFRQGAAALLPDERFNNFLPEIPLASLLH